jgi:serine/threonine protein kinase
MIGETILHYKVLEKLGEGGMGVVYKAEDTKLKREVAIKFLPHHISANEVERKRFEIEAHAAASLNHSNISTIHATEKTASEVFIVMEFIDGIELKDKINPPSSPLSKRGDTGGLPAKEVINIAIQIAEGIEAAHKKGIIHRDIKSQNIMITKAGKVKIMDFGLAKLQGEAGLTKSGSTLGTVSYMSPEQATNEPVDHRSDIWSFGVLLYEMITGELPFKGKHEAGILYSIVHSELPKIQNVDCPEGLGFIVQKALVKNPDERYQNMSEILNDLKTIESGNVLSKPHIKKTSHKAGVFIVVLIAIVASLIFLFQSKQEPKDNRPPMRTVRLTSYSGEEYDPVFSPDGQTIAFSWNGPYEDNFDIYTKRLDGGNPVRLTTAIQKDTKPAWSPDGKKIAFIRELDDSREIVVLPSSGGTEQKVTEMASVGSDIWPNISWSMDNEFIYYPDHALSAAFVIKRIHLKTGKREQVTSLPPGVWGDLDTHMLPDGKHLLFRRGSPGFFDLYVLNLDNKSVRQLTHINTVIYGFCWHNESKSVLFSANLDGTIALWKTDLSGSEPQKVHSEVSICNPQVFEKGERLVYNQRIWGYSIWKLNLRNPTEDEIFIKSSYENLEPNISPNGEKILFSSNRTGTHNIWLADSNGNNQTQLTYFEDKIWAGNGNWSPDGSEILINFQNYSYKMKANGADLDTLGDMGIFATWNANGTGFYGRPGTKNGLYAFTAEALIGDRITEGPALAPKVYEDYIYFIRNWNQLEIWRIPVSGGTEEPVLTGVKDLFLRSWQVVKTGIYFFHFVDKKPVLSFYDFKTKEVKLVKRMPDAGAVDIFVAMDIDPREQYLLYSKEDPVKSDIIMVENFRTE